MSNDDKMVGTKTLREFSDAQADALCKAFQPKSITQDEMREHVFHMLDLVYLAATLEQQHKQMQVQSEHLRNLKAQ
jgi:hypothetical protein